MKKPKAPSIVTIAVMTTVTIIFWIFYSVYVALTHKPPSDIPPELLENISPVLETETLDTLPNKLFFEDDDVESFVLSNTANNEKSATGQTPAKVTPTPKVNSGIKTGAEPSP